MLLKTIKKAAKFNWTYFSYIYEASHSFRLLLPLSDQTTATFFSPHTHSAFIIETRKMNFL